MDELEYLVLSNSVALSRKQKSDAEYVLSEYTKLLNDERNVSPWVLYCSLDFVTCQNENVAIIWGMANAYMILKQVPKARNQLKRIAKNNWKYWVNGKMVLI